MCSDDVNDCVECAICIACCYACCLCCCKGKMGQSESTYYDFDFPDKNNSSVANQPSPAIISQPHYGGGGGGGYPQDQFGQYNQYGPQMKDSSGFGGYPPNMGGGQYPGQGQFGNNPYPPQQGYPASGAPPPYSFHQGPPPPGSYFPPQGGPDNQAYYPPNAPPPPQLYPTTHNLPDQGKY